MSRAGEHQRHRGVQRTAGDLVARLRRIGPVRSRGPGRPADGARASRSIATAVRRQRATRVPTHREPDPRGPRRAATAAASSTTSTDRPPPATPSTTARTTTGTAEPRRSPPRRADRTAARARPRRHRPAPLLVTQLTVHRLGAAGDHGRGDGYGTSTATVHRVRARATGWTQVFGPWSAYIGRNGVAPAGAKREGDGRTPSGAYGFDFMFGVDPDPGVQFPFRPHHRLEHRLGRRSDQPELQRVDRHEHRSRPGRARADGQRAVRTNTAR